MQRKLYLFILFSIFCGRLLALEAAISHSVFYLPDPFFKGKINPYVEAYWQVNPKTVRYNTIAGKGIVARIQTDVEITNDSGKVIKDDHYVFQTLPRATADELTMLNILELKRYFIISGKLKMQLVLTDLNDTSNHLTLVDTFTVPPQPVSVFYGGPEFIDTFFTADIKSPFRKHGQQYIPLCESFFDNFRNSLSYYTELYQIGTVGPSDFPLVQSVFLSKKLNDDALVSYMKIDTLKDSTSNYFSGKFDISNLASGNYYLNVSLGTKTHRTLASKSLFFQRLNTKPTKPEEVFARKAALDSSLEKVNIVDLSKTFVAKYTLSQVNAILKMLLPVADISGSHAIEGFLNKPDETYMRYYIYNYFEAINKKDPEKAWKEYSEKVKQVNKMFSNNGKMGFETPRGFMYLRYGAPTEIVTRNNEQGALPYELWQYNNLKEMSGLDATNAYILFYKSSDADFDFKVLHTTISGELHNMGWRSFLYTSTIQNADHSNSLADQSIGNR